ncbi:hypothetical protein [Cryptosporangium sp. NPDC051539]|uniref:hypothetical protein n=1 Tax=Cryptosporangium sp. NPDC051539 TaxID=3363962 RepID=UPI00378B96E1
MPVDLDHRVQIREAVHLDEVGARRIGVLRTVRDRQFASHDHDRPIVLEPPGAVAELLRDRLFDDHPGGVLGGRAGSNRLPPEVQQLLLQFHDLLPLGRGELALVEQTVGQRAFGREDSGVGPEALLRRRDRIAIALVGRDERSAQRFVAPEELGEPLLREAATETRSTKLTKPPGEAPPGRDRLQTGDCHDFSPLS